MSLGIDQACQGEGKGQSCALLTHSRSSPSRVPPALCPGAAVCLGAIAPQDDTNDLSPISSAPRLTCDHQVGPVALHHFIGFKEGNQPAVVGA